MSDPSPSSLNDDGAHAVLVAAGEEMLVGDGFGPEYSQASKVLGGEGLERSTDVHITNYTMVPFRIC